MQVVVSNAPSCGGMQFAAANGIPTLQYPGRKDDPDALSPEALVRALKQEHGVDIVCLAGYMKVRAAGCAAGWVASSRARLDTFLPFNASMPRVCICSQVA